MSRRVRDTLTLNLFNVPTPAPPLTGNLDLDVPLRTALADALKHADDDRHKIAAEMSRLTGREVSKFMLDAYTAESRQDHNFPFRYAAAFEQATGSYCLTNLLAQARGCEVLVGEDALFAELGRIEKMETELKQQKAALKRFMRRR
ncbi:hypothetical protein [Dethiosulfatarculus sandiegensis]|uniref:Uncharacterized protein n=1 Tax=Dethiosulfatarculus sandiegensis TaxID=1429043 RepID=A0A0D2JGU6_9BACT|nr:hypothetical protein [Dethiosulfatarculus sandiegensis]KIX14966.1 hypothetical protein X474_05585 [Dethiosulfatarculus sandiegensis]